MNAAQALANWPFFSRQAASLSSVPIVGSRRSLASNFSHAAANEFCFISLLASRNSASASGLCACATAVIATTTARALVAVFIGILGIMVAHGGTGRGVGLH